MPLKLRSAHGEAILGDKCSIKQLLSGETNSVHEVLDELAIEAWLEIRIFLLLRCRLRDDRLHQKSSRPPACRLCTRSSRLWHSDLEKADGQPCPLLVGHVITARP